MRRWLANALWVLRGGLFRVVYPDGQISAEMPFRAARGYATIFGGAARPARDFERCPGKTGPPVRLKAGGGRA